MKFSVSPYMGALTLTIAACTHERPGPNMGHASCIYEQPVVAVRVFGPHGVAAYGNEVAKAYYPYRALTSAKGGSATLICDVEAQVAHRCEAVREDGIYGFGGASIRLISSLPAPSGSDGARVTLHAQWMVLEPSRRNDARSINCNGDIQRAIVTDAGLEANTP